MNCAVLVWDLNFDSFYVQMSMHSLVAYRVFQSNCSFLRSFLALKFGRMGPTAFGSVMAACPTMDLL